MAMAPWALVGDDVSVEIDVEAIAPLNVRRQLGSLGRSMIPTEGTADDRRREHRTQLASIRGATNPMPHSGYR